VAEFCHLVVQGEIPLAYVEDVDPLEARRHAINFATVYGVHGVAINFIPPLISVDVAGHIAP
jgi:hypothetical protein